MTLIYPAVFYRDAESDGYAVEVPDLPGCATGGDDIEEALFMAVDAASGWVLTELEAGRRAPKASAIFNIKPVDETGFVSLIALDMDTYSAKYGKRAVRKNLTIPAYLNTFAEEHGYNFSQILQEALINKIRE